MKLDYKKVLLVGSFYYLITEMKEDGVLDDNFKLKKEKEIRRLKDFEPLYFEIIDTYKRMKDELDRITDREKYIEEFDKVIKTIDKDDKRDVNIILFSLLLSKEYFKNPIVLKSINRLIENISVGIRNHNNNIVLNLRTSWLAKNVIRILKGESYIPNNIRLLNSIEPIRKMFEEYDNANKK